METTVTLTNHSRVCVDWTNPDNIRRTGLKTPKGSKLVHANSKIVVVKIKSYRENPGSRYSMLGRTRYAAETIVYAIVEKLGENVAWCIEVARY